MKNLIIFIVLCAMMALTACGGSSSKTSVNNNSEDSIASALRQRGFTDGSGYSDDKNMVFLKGEVYGEKAELTIDTNGGKVNSVVVTNDLDADYSMKQAAQRCKNLMDKLAEQYNAEWETVCEGYYELKLPYGKASCSYASGCAAGYEVVLNIVDSVETE